MKTARHLVEFLSVCCLAVSGFGQTLPPANDSCTNPIVLSGSDISFTGTLAGATRESDLGESTPQLDYTADRTVWWQWTPTQSTTVIIQILNSSQTANGKDGVELWKLRATTPYFLGDPLAGWRMHDRLPFWFFTYSAKSGTNYHIQLAGTNAASFNLRLIATNLPFVVAPPENQTVTVGDSVLFSVVVAGSQPFTYQWQFNGDNLPSETAPMLALNAVTTNQTGSYRVWITNSTGAIVSQPASLSVTAGDTASFLSVIQPPTNNEFAFFVLGDVGRRYRIQFSTNLTDWFPEPSFPAPIFYDTTESQSPLRSVVLNSSGELRLALSVTRSKTFIRATPFHAVNETCNNNLKAIRFAQILFGHDQKKTPQDVVAVSDLLPYLKNNQFPACPSGGEYFLWTVAANPTCTLHLFEEQ